MMTECSHTNKRNTYLNRSKWLNRSLLAAGLVLTACSAENNSAPGSAASVTSALPANTTTSTSLAIKVEQPTTSMPVSKLEGVKGCAPYFNFSKYKNHEYEVCVAYIANASELALYPMYKFGNNSGGDVAGIARNHFESRYWQRARTEIEQRVNAWPKTFSLAGNDVQYATYIDSVGANLAADRGLLKTEESWQVLAPDGGILYNEPLGQQSVTMCRGKLPYPAIGGIVLHHPLHEWMVVDFNSIPNYNCLEFDKAHNIEP